MSDVVRRPSTAAAFLEQVRTVGLSIRGEAWLVGVLLGFLSIGLGMAIWREDMAVHVRPDNYLLLALIGAVMPFAVWKHREGLDASVFLTLPVDHRRHALLRVLAGWVWLMIAVAGVLAWLAVLVTTSGGTFGSDAMRLVLPGAQPDAIVDPAALREIRWATPGWHWFIPFTGATIAYGLASAVNLATKHPVRVVGGIVVVLLLLGAATGEYAFEWMRIALHYVLVHPWGLDTAFTAGSESLKTLVRVGSAGAEPTSVWRALPTLGAWLGATLLWSVITAVALWAATLRLRER